MFLPNFRLFYGLTLIFAHLINRSIEDDCTTSTIDNLLTADCSMRGVFEVPQDLDPNIQVLKLSNNTIDGLKSKDFQRYKQLEMLYLNNIDKGPKTSEGERTKLREPIETERTAFFFMEKLKVLDLSFSFFGFDPRFEFAKSIEVLHLEGTNYQFLDISTLGNLKELYAGKNRLEEAPIFNEIAPIVYIDLKGNPLKILNISTFAPFCLLNYFGVDVPKNWEYETNQYCECSFVAAWVSKHEIQGIYPPLNCTKTSKTKRCKSPITKKMKETYNKCLIKWKNKKNWLKYLIMVVLFSLAVILLLPLIMIAKYIKTKISGAPDEGASIEN